ncbi:GMC family oxidoreductase [Colwellia sp. RSH04]|uniref:GMC family oxidoreductase n=1 Tax=Colwellia sp. RSH04 TaxID=2305464 RepID=UPI000E5758AC|nr:choline dehydrogenase [Colwellia sp. RSH04]RHW75538.1 FAD-dependent oxidoreductase [Colwellia sp. RSH04]
MKEFDFVIVGGGSAGCVLADKLSENAEFTVCLIEAGPKDTHWSIHLPLGVIDLMKNKSLNWQFNSTPETTQNNRKVFNPRGKTLGGSSSINAMLYIRGQKEDYNHWAELGNKGWSYAEVLPYFKAVENHERGADEFHGVGGQLNVADSRSKPVIQDRFIAAAHNAGYPLNDDFNGKSQEGVGYYQLTQKDGQRCSAATAFLTPNLSRKNLTVITNAHVNELLIKDKQAYGVNVTIKGVAIEIIARKEVLLCAGAFNSPQLLMLSGVGPKEELTKHNISVKHELKGVGQNLQDHVDALVVSKHQHNELLAYRPKAINWFIKESFKYFSLPFNKNTQRKGILTSVVAEAGGFIKANKQSTRPDLQLHFIPAAMDDHGRNHKMLFNYGISLHVCLLRPKSRGEVKLFGKNPRLDPAITLNMLSDKNDQEYMINAVKIARTILNQTPLIENNLAELSPGKQVQSDEDILKFLKEKANTIYHPVGTCKMGQDDMAVVDNQLKVHGIENLRVIDASIMPTLISGNTNAPTMMIATKAAEMILNEHC